MNNIGTDEDPQFPECDANLSDKNLEQDNHSSDSEIYMNQMMRLMKIIEMEDFILEKIKSQNENKKRKS